LPITIRISSKELLKHGIRKLLLCIVPALFIAVGQFPFYIEGVT
jgi:hypothetical protein